MQVSFFVNPPNAIVSYSKTQLALLLQLPLPSLSAMVFFTNQLNLCDAPKDEWPVSLSCFFPAVTPVREACVFQICWHMCLVAQLCPARCGPMDQAPLLMEFPKQEHWSGVPFLPLGDLPNSGIEPLSLYLLHCQADFFLTTSTTWDVCAKLGKSRNGKKKKKVCVMIL